MRRCKVCNASMVVRLSKTEPFIDKYFWECTAFPECCNIENTILSKVDRPFISMFCSMHKWRPTDSITDSERHYAIERRFGYGHTFGRTEIENLDMQLGFQEREDFFFWVATQQYLLSISPRSLYHYFPVASPYDSTIKNLIEGINQFFPNKFTLPYCFPRDLERFDRIIRDSMSEWADSFQKEAEHRYNMLQEDKKKHEEAVKRKADKASIEIFNAIRRKDLRAIEALRRKGADLTVKNENGLTSLQYARTLEDERLIEMLQQALHDGN